jgi:hypothetical protein
MNIFTFRGILTRAEWPGFASSSLMAFGVTRIGFNLPLIQSSVAGMRLTIPFSCSLESSSITNSLRFSTATLTGAFTVRLAVTHIGYGQSKL